MAGQTFPANPDIGVIWRFTQDSTGLTNYVDYDGTALTAAKVGDIVFWEGTQWRRVGLGGHFETVVRAIALTGGFSSLLGQSQSPGPGPSASPTAAIPIVVSASPFNVVTTNRASSITIKGVKEGSLVRLRLMSIGSVGSALRVRRASLTGPVVGGGPVSTSYSSSDYGYAAPAYIVDDAPGTGDVTYHITGDRNDNAVTLQNIMAEELAAPVTGPQLATAKDLEDVQTALDAIIGMLGTTGSEQQVFHRTYDQNGIWSLLVPTALEEATDRFSFFFDSPRENLNWDLGVSDTLDEEASPLRLNRKLTSNRDDRTPEVEVQVPAGKFLWIRYSEQDDPAREIPEAPNLRARVNTTKASYGTKLRCSLEGVGDAPDYGTPTYEWYFRPHRDTGAGTKIADHAVNSRLFSGYDTDTLTIPTGGVSSATSLWCTVTQTRAGDADVTASSNMATLSTYPPIRAVVVIAS